IAAIKKMLLEGGTEKALSNMKLFSKKLEIYQLKTFLLQCGLMTLSLRLVSIISCFLLSSCLLGDMCSNTIDFTMVSPDGKKKIVMFDRDCGATTAGSTQISLLSSSENLSNISGNIFVSDRGNVKMEWLSNREILITYPSDLTTFNKIDSFSDVLIRYTLVK
ncbi:MAG: hypothetical protein ABIN67_10165, partial [Ferruginibacter sp.]